MDRSPPNLETLAGRIKALRVARGMKRYEVAEKVGVSRVCYHDWETGNVAEPKLGPIVAFAELVDIDMDWLIRRKGPDPIDQRNSPRITARYIRIAKLRKRAEIRVSKRRARKRKAKK